LPQAEAAADEEVGTAQLRIAEAQAAAAAAAADRNAAEAAAASAKQQAAAARAEAGRLGRELQAVQQAAEATALDARQQLAAKDRELSRLSSELDGQQMRACVLLETLETLQVRVHAGVRDSTACLCLSHMTGCAWPWVQCVRGHTV
jgi:hypothetical protein